MARWSKSDKARIELRRAEVQKMAARGLGVYEITEKLARLVVNPETGEPYSVATVSRDLGVIEERWREAAVQERDEARARQVAQLQEARRIAWQAGDYGEVRRNIETEAKLMGTEAPKRQEISGPEGGPIQTEQLNDTRERLLASIQKRLETDDARSAESVGQGAE